MLLKDSVKKKYLSFFAIICWTLLIIYLSSGPGAQLPLDWGDIIGIDKLGHLVFYGIHTFLLAWALKENELLVPGKEKYIYVFLTSAVLGIAMEIMQGAFYPNRYFEFLDIFANIIGSFLGMTIFKRLVSYTKSSDF